MRSPPPGDALTQSCAKHCKSSMSRHCTHCTCASCDFANCDAHTLPSMSMTTEQLISSRAALQRSDSIPSPMAPYCACGVQPCRCVGGLEGSNSFFERSSREMSSVAAAQQWTTRPASLLRGTCRPRFAGGRCTIQWPRAVVSQSAPPQQPNHTSRDGFWSTFPTGVGWILGELPTHRHGASFGHDAWNSEPYQPSCSRTMHGLLRPWRNLCRGLKRAVPWIKRSSWNELQRRRQVQGLVSSRWNCVHGVGGRAAGSGATSLVAAEYAASSSQFSTPSTAECSSNARLQPGARLVESQSHPCDIPHVNDTHTPAIYAKRHRTKACKA